MKTRALEKTAEVKLKQFVTQWVKGAEKAWNDMRQKCIELEQACQEFGQDAVYSEIVAQFPQLNYPSLDQMRAVGQGRMPHRLLLDPSPASLYLKRLPFDEAKKVLEEGVLLLLPGAAGENDEVKTKKHSELGAAQCRQVFDDHVRSIEEQREWLIQKRLYGVRSAKVAEDFAMIGEYVEIAGPLKLKLTEVKQWCSRLLAETDKALGSA